METPQERINRLQRELREAQSKVASCSHEWGDIVFDPGIEYEHTFVGYSGEGSDPWPEYTSSPKKVNRWRRDCKKCGKSEYTKEQEVVSQKIEYKPKF